MSENKTGGLIYRFPPTVRSTSGVWGLGVRRRQPCRAKQQVFTPPLDEQPLPLNHSGPQASTGKGAADAPPVANSCVVLRPGVYAVYADYREGLCSSCPTTKLRGLFAYTRFVLTQRANDGVRPCPPTSSGRIEYAA